MNTAKVYYGLDGKACTILQMVLREPEWAAKRIQEGEHAIARLNALGAAHCGCAGETKGGQGMKNQTRNDMPLVGQTFTLWLWPYFCHRAGARRVVSGLTKAKADEIMEREKDRAPGVMFIEPDEMPNKEDEG